VALSVQDVDAASHPRAGAYADQLPLYLNSASKKYFRMSCVMSNLGWAEMSRAWFGRNGLAKHLLVVVVGFSSAITAAITFGELYADYRQDLRAMSASFEFIASSAVPSLTISVWQVDTDLIQSQLEGLLRLRDIEFAAVETAGVLRWSAGRIASRRTLTTEIPLVQTEGRTQLQIGTLRLAASVDQAVARVWDRAIVTLLANFIKTLLVAGFLLVAFNRLVTNHLMAVAEFVRDIDPAQNDEPPRTLALRRKTPSRWQPDILDTVADAINSLLQFLRLAQADLLASHRSLSESELRSRLATEAAGAGLWDCDLVQGNVVGNAECARILGLSPAELRTDMAFWRDLPHPEDAEPALANIRRHLAGEIESIRIEIRLRHALTSWRWMSVRGRVVERGSDGQALRAVGTLVDIDDRKLGEAVLKDREEKFRGITEMTIDLIFQIDPEGSVIYVSRSIQSIFGLSPDEVVGRPFLALVATEHRAEAAQLLARLAEGNTVRDLELLALRKDGSRFPFEANATPIRIDGRVVGVQGVLRDISERRRAEETLKMTEARLRTLTANAAAWVYELDANGRVTFANRPLRRGTSPVGSLAVDWYPSDQKSLFREAWAKVMTEGGRQRFETSSLGKAKRRHHYMNTIALMEGAPSGTTALSVHDITELKVAEEALRHANSGLESRVRERTAALQAARDEAERAIRAKSDFLARMTHELRTPLNGILGSAEILETDANLKDGHARALNVIHQSGVHLLRLITDLLDLAQSDRSRLELLPDWIELRSVVNVIAETVHARARLKDLEFVAHVAEGVPWSVRTDQKRLSQVLLNLLTNAIEFADRGTVTLRIRRVRVAPHAVHAGIAEMVRLHFEVEDCGIGMNPEDLDRIFLPFEQISHDGQLRVGGAGIGLAISRELVRLMGGNCG